MSVPWVMRSATAVTTRGGGGRKDPKGRDSASGCRIPDPAGTCFPGLLVLIAIMVATIHSRRPREARTIMNVVGLCMATILLFSACTPTAGPEATAERFVERYYVSPDLPGAKALAYGLARQKIEEEERLLQAMTLSAAAADRGVSYSLHATRKIEDDKIFFVYDITISVDRQVMKKRATIATGRLREGWRVTNFQEVDI